MISIVSTELLRVASESLILPIDVVNSAKELKKDFSIFESRHKAELENLGISLDQFRESVDNLTSVAMRFQERLDKLDKTK